MQKDENENIKYDVYTDPITGEEFWLKIENGIIDYEDMEELNEWLERVEAPFDPEEELKKPPHERRYTKEENDIMWDCILADLGGEPELASLVLYPRVVESLRKLDLNTVYYASDLDLVKNGTYHWRVILWALEIIEMVFRDREESSIMNDSAQNGRLVNLILEECPSVSEVEEMVSDARFHLQIVENENVLQETLEVFFRSQWNDCYGVTYLITDNNIDNFWNNKMFYAGQTIRKIRKRFRSHLVNPTNQYIEEAFNRFNKKFKLKSKSILECETDNDEFSIKVVKKCKNSSELNQAEIELIKKYKTLISDYHQIQNNKIIPLYGFNVSRGGQGHNLYLRGLLNPSYVIVDKDELTELIKEGYSREEISSTIGVSLSYLNEKIKEVYHNEGINNLSQAYKYFGSLDKFFERYKVKNQGKSNFGPITIDTKLLLEMIMQGAFLKEIEDTLNVSDETIYDRLQGLGYKNMTEAREDLGVMEIYKEKYSKNIQNLDQIFRSKEEHPDWIEISADRLKEYLEKGIKVEDIASQFGVARETIRRRILYFWGVSWDEAVRLFKYYPAVNRHLLLALIDDDASMKEIDEEFLKYLISLGKHPKEFGPSTIAPLIGKAEKYVRERIKDLGFTFQSIKDEYWYKPKIIEMIKKQYSIAQMNTEQGVVDTYYTVVPRIWNKEFLFFSKRLPTAPINPLLFYLYRYYIFYPRLDISLLRDLDAKNATPLEIDKTFLTLLARQFNKTQAMQFLNISARPFDRLIFETFGKKYTEL